MSATIDINISQMSSFEKALTVNKYLSDGRYSGSRSEKVRARYKQEHPKVLNASKVIKHVVPEEGYDHNSAITLLKRIFCKQ